MRLCIRFCFVLASILLQLSTNIIAQTVIAPVRLQQPVNEEIVVKYSGVPRLQGDGFYMLFLFGSGGSFHDSKSVDRLPDGTIRFSALDKSGNYNLILFAYNNINDNKPKKVTSAVLKLVAAPSTSISKTETSPAISKPGTGSVTNGIQDFSTSEQRKSTFYLSTAKLSINEPITVSYSLPDLSADSNYYISVSRPEDRYAANSSNILATSSGSATLKPIYQEGVYELRVYRSAKKTGLSSLAYRQPLGIGKINKSFVGMYSCPAVEPSVSGKRIPSGPSIQQVKQLLTQTLLKSKDAWIDDEDVCIEISLLQYMNSQSMSVPISATKKTVSVTAFPVVVRYKITVNDHFNMKAIAKEPGISQQFVFYKQLGAWQVLKPKS